MPFVLRMKSDTSSISISLKVNVKHIYNRFLRGGGLLCLLD